MKTSRPIIIAHRGASGYLPEHTLAAKAVAQVDNHIPVRIAQELGIWCDEDAEDQEPINRRDLAEGADGIYKLTPGEPDVIRTDGEFINYAWVPYPVVGISHPHAPFIVLLSGLSN